jgi:hypothetical protein
LLWFDAESVKGGQRSAKKGMEEGRACLDIKLMVSFLLLTESWAIWKYDVHFLQYQFNHSQQLYDSMLTKPFYFFLVPFYCKIKK